jgi:hypothetical protein
MDAVANLDFDGKRYSLDLDSITTREFREVLRHTELEKPAQFLAACALDVTMPVAEALLWLFRKRNGATEPIAEMDMPYFGFLEAFRGSNPDDEPDVEIAAEVGEVPKVVASTPSTSTPKAQTTVERSVSPTEPV